MQAFDLNLASRPFKNNALLWTGHLVAILLLSAFTAWSVQTYRDRTRYLEEMKQALGLTAGEFERLDQRDRKALQAIEKFDLEVLEVQAGRANQAIEWQAFSWTRLFNRMAEVQPNDFKMLSIRPIFRGGRAAAEQADGSVRQPGVPVMVEGVAKSFEAVTEIQDSLLAHPNFDGVEPERLDRIDRSEFLFKLRFHYLPEIDVEPAVEAPAEVSVATAQAETTGDVGPEAEGGAASDPLPETGAGDAEPPGAAMELTRVEDAWNGPGSPAPVGGDQPAEEAASEPTVDGSAAATAPGAAPDPAAAREAGPRRSKAKGKAGKP